jgi:hypothetical protein
MRAPFTEISPGVDAASIYTPALPLQNAVREEQNDDASFECDAAVQYGGRRTDSGPL